MTESATYRTRYLRDPKNPNRVMTLVTKVEGPTVVYAVAVNAPKESRCGNVPYRPGDRFIRKTGSMIARARLDVGSGKYVNASGFNPETQHPFVVALTQLSTWKTEKGKTTSVARIARAELARMVKIIADKAAQKAYSGTLEGADRESI